jgi:hypothetical protein
MRINPSEAANTHEYISYLHSGRDEDFNLLYNKVHDEFFGQLAALETGEKKA